MARQPSSRPQGVVLLHLCLLLGASSIAVAEDSYRETRRHWAPDPKVIADHLPPDRREEFLKSTPVPNVTVITRDWGSSSGKSEKPSAGPTTRRLTVVLFDPAVDRLRFGWWEDRDWEGARGRYRLKIWYSDGSKDELGLTVKYPQRGHDMQSDPTESRKVREKGTFVGDEQLPITVDFADRKLTLSVSEWRRGLLSVDDKAWLESVKRPRLAAALRTIASISPAFSQLQMACDLAVFPLLGEYERMFEPAAESLVTVRGRPDCDFDAWFGEPCSLKEQMEFDLGKNPQVAPPSK